MQLLSDRINSILVLLDDSCEENDWDLIQQAINELEEIHETVERQESGFEVEY